MRYFAGLNLQDVWIFLFPALIFIMVLALALGFSHVRNRDSGRRKHTVNRNFPEGISEKRAPFPMAMALIIAGTILWGFLYILVNGLLGVKI
jgi:hypothetical protein